MSDAGAATQYDDTSGPVVARTFHRLLAVTFLVAWWSLGRQVDVLIGSRGLLPLSAYLGQAERAGVTFWNFPTIFWWGSSDTLLESGVWIGALLAVLALAGIYPRVCIALSTALYLSYATAARTFLSFQWDNLLLECGALAVFLPTDRRAPWIHLLFRCLLFKLYWESGVAKWQSYLGDWQDGSAMTYYYETAPLPTWMAWYAHNLPGWWHHAESQLVLVLELMVPFGIFATRRIRLITAALFLGFQAANAATANYGFFCYLSAALGVFLLTDRDLSRLTCWLPGTRRTAIPSGVAGPRRTRLRFAVAAVVTVVFFSVSAVDALLSFSGSPALARALQPLQERYDPWRLINTYHLFGQITRERIEPQFETFDGQTWTEHDFRYKAGATDRPPLFVAPHQPRVDFQLWFYGLSFQHGTPAYVAALLDRLCHDPSAVQSLFSAPLPEKPEAVRIVFWRYRFSAPDTPASPQMWWVRERAVQSRPIPCATIDQS